MANSNTVITRLDISVIAAPHVGRPPQPAPRQVHTRHGGQAAHFLILQECFGIFEP